MAVVPTLVLSAAVNLPSGPGGGAQVVGTLSFATDEVFVAFVLSNMWDDTTGYPSALAAASNLSFTRRGETAVFDGYSRISVWTGKATGTGSSSNITMTIPSTWDGYIVQIYKIDGSKITGTNGADLIRGSQIASATGAKPLTATLGSAMTSGNKGLAFGGAYNNSLTAETCSSSDWPTELADINTTLPDTGSYSMYGACYVSTDHTDNAPTLNWSGTAAGAYGLIVIEIDAEPGGTNLTGQGAGISVAAGSISVGASQSLDGRTAAVSAALGSLGMIPSSGLTGRTASILCSYGLLSQEVVESINSSQSSVARSNGSVQVEPVSMPISGGNSNIGLAFGSFGLGGALLGQGASIVATAGQLGPSDSTSLSGYNVGVSVSHGFLGNSPGLPGYSVTISVSSGQIGQNDSYQLGGNSSSISVSHGSFGPGGTSLSGLTVSISRATGLFGISDSSSLVGQGSNIAVYSGQLGTGLALTGGVSGIAVSHGSFIGLSAEEPLGGFNVSIQASMGSLGSPGGSVLSGRTSNIAVSNGQIGQLDSYSLPGAVSLISVSSGQLGSGSDRALVSGSRSISVSAGQIGASGDGQTGVTGLAVSVQVSSGQLGGNPNHQLPGHVASISVQHGSIMSVNPLLGRFVGIAVSAGQLGESGTSNSPLGSASRNIQTNTGLLFPIAQENMPSLGSRIGANQLPANPAARNGKGVYTVTDISLATLLELIAASVRAECGSMYENVMGENECIKQIIPFDTLEWDNLSVFEYPLLSLHPEGHGESFAAEIGLEVKPMTYVLRYVLPPMTARKFYVMNGFLSAVDNATRAAISNGYHPDYMNGMQVLVGDDSIAQINKLKIKSSRRGRIHISTEIHHNMIETKIYVEEVVKDNPNILQTLNHLRGIDGDATLEDLPIAEWEVDYS